MLFRHAILLSAILAPYAAKAEIAHQNLPTTEPVVFEWDSQGTRLVSGQGGTYAMDIDGNGTTDFTFNYGTGFSIVPANGNAVWSQFPGQLDNTGYALPLSGGSVLDTVYVSQGWYFGPSLLHASRDPINLGYFSGLESGYLGIQFQSGDETHYGWIRAGAPVSILNGGWAYDYAWETTPGAGITIGAVPEPGTIALFAAGAAGLYWKRRRKNLRGS